MKKKIKAKIVRHPLTHGSLNYRVYMLVKRKGTKRYQWTCVAIGNKHLMDLL